MQLFSDYMYMQNPLDRFEFEIHEPIDWDTELTDFDQLNAFMSELRFDEGALPETYYFGLVDVCSGGLGGAGGKAYGIPSDPVNPDVAYQRVSSGLSLAADWSAETFVHEVGHSQGRRHVACNGEGGPDPTYPHDGGDVGEWGFGVIDFNLRHPTAYKDYMTYCHPTWVGSWGWNKVYPVIQGLSEWDRDFPGGAPQGDPPLAAIEQEPYSGSVLVGIVSSTGFERWFTAPGGVPGAELGEATQIELTMADGSTVVQAASVQQTQDGSPSQLIVTPLPPGWEDGTGVTRLSAGARHPVPRAEIGVHHHQRTVVRPPPPR